MWYIQNTKTKKYLSFIEMQPVWVDSKENAVTFTMQEISNECIITFNNKLDGLDFVKA